MPGRVIVVGSVNVDLFAFVDRLPTRGETVTGATFGRHPGGKGGNQATAAARLGAAVTFVGAVGRDSLADEARTSLAEEGIGVGELSTLDDPTAVALIIVDAEGENLIAVASGANGALTAAMVEGALERLTVTAGDVVVTCNEIPAVALSAALRAGRAAGATTILNPAPATGLGARHLIDADIVVPNRGELEALVGSHDRDTDNGASRPDGDPVTQARRLLEPTDDGRGVGVAVVVTLGADGAVLVRPEAEPRWIAARRVRTVDTVGAGDAFVGALAAGLAEGGTLDEATNRAVVAASISTTKQGARGGMPTLAELEAALTVD